MRAADLRKVELGNAIARATFEDAHAAALTGKLVAIENPENSYMWLLPESVALEQLPGFRRATFSNCLFGGQRAKLTTVLTNVPEIFDALDGKICRGKVVCDRTGTPHATWRPTVAHGQIIEYQTAGEAEYPQELCDKIGQALVARIATLEHVITDRILFSEIFSGPRAPLSARVARHLAAAQTSSS